MRVSSLRPAGRLDRYVAELFAAAYATAFLLVVGLVLILNFAGNLDYFEPWEEGGRATTLEIVRFYLLSIPYYFLQVGPFVTLIAGLFTLAKLVKNNELVAAMSAGVSARRVLQPVIMGGALAGLGLFALREVAALYVAPQRDGLHDVLENHRRERLDQLVWVRDEWGNTARLESWRGGRIEGLFAILKKGRVRRIVRAAGADWIEDGGGGRWILEEGRTWAEGRSSEVQDMDELEGIEFTPRDVATVVRSLDRALELSYAEVFSLARRDPDNLQYQTLLQYLLTFPLANLVLLMVGLPFMVGRERGRSFEGLVAGCLLCVLYFCVDSLTREWGLNGDLPPLVASWFPLVLFGSLGIVLWEGMRT